MSFARVFRLEDATKLIHKDTKKCIECQVGWLRDFSNFSISVMCFCSVYCTVWQKSV